MYASARILLLPGIPQHSDVHNWEQAFHYLDTVAANGGRRSRRLKDLWKKPSTARAPETPVEFFVMDHNAFSLGLADTLSICYQYAEPTQMDKEELDAMQAKQQDHLGQIAQGLAMALVCMNENPYIRYSANRQERQLSEMLAESVADRLDAWKESHPEWRPWGTPGEKGKAGGGGKGKKGRRGEVGDVGEEEDYGGGGGGSVGGRARQTGASGEERTGAATLLIVDRLDDIAPALLHGGLRGTEYSPLLMDLFDYDPLDTLTFTKKNGDECEMLLSDEGDPCWRFLRRATYGSCTEAVSEARERYVAAQEEEEEGGGGGDDDDGDYGGGGGGGKVAAMREKMFALVTEEHLAQEKFKEHLSLLNAVKFARDSRDIAEVCDLELALVTGVDCVVTTDNYGKTVPKTTRVWDASKTYFERVRECLKGEKLSDEDKARLACLAILCMDKVDTKKTHKDLLDTLPSDLREAVLNLEDFYVPLVRKNKERCEGAPIINSDSIKAQETNFSE